MHQDVKRACGTVRPGGSGPKNPAACPEGAYSREMHSHHTFENPPALPHDTVLDLLSRAVSGDSAEAVQAKAASAMVGTALNDDDRAFIEQCCLEVAARVDPGCHLLGLVGLCLGHAARRFGTLSDEAIALAQSLAHRAERDATDVDGRALDGLEDIQHFIRR
jgi:hypothetical protein